MLTGLRLSTNVAFHGTIGVEMVAARDEPLDSARPEEVVALLRDIEALRSEGLRPATIRLPPPAAKLPCIFAPGYDGIQSGNLASLEPISRVPSALFT